MSKVEQNKEKKRQAILLAAQDVFLSEGYILASMDKIATQAQVTKQTIYRYYASKSDLFKATLQQMGDCSEHSFLRHLQESNTKKALYQFARDFIHAHLTDEHLATIRLLVTESATAPEITSSFFAVGPDETATKLSEFFAEKLGINNAEMTVQMWTAMLLSHREAALLGMGKPSKNRIEAHAREATDFLLAANS